MRIEGYKSIAFCDVYLQPLTILVSRNAVKIKLGPYQPDGKRTLVLVLIDAEVG